MPWCDTCDRLVDDEDLVDGRLPDLRRPTSPSRSASRSRGGSASSSSRTVIYLIWRFVQGVQWLTHHA